MNKRTRGRTVMVRILVVSMLLGSMLLYGSAGYAYEFWNMSIHGFIGQGYLKTTDNNYYMKTSKGGSFALRETGLTVSAPVTDKVVGGVQILALDVGDLWNNNVILDWAFVDYLAGDYFGIRAGRLKTPMGLYNQGRDVDMVRPTIFLPQSVYTDMMRDVVNAYDGGCIYGNIPLGGLGTIDYEFVIGDVDLGGKPFVEKYVNFTNKSAVEPALLGFFAQQPQLGITPRSSTLTNTSANMEYLLGTALRWDTPIEGLRFGGSLVRGDVRMAGDYEVFVETSLSGLTAPMKIPYKLDSKIKIKPLWAVSMEFKRDKLTIAGEYLSWDMDVLVDLSSDYSTLGAVLTQMGTNKRSVTTQAYYGLISYRLFDFAELGAYYGFSHPNKNDKDGKALEAAGLPDFLAWQHDICVFTKLYVTSSLLVKFEAHSMDGMGQLYLDLDNNSNPDDWERRWELFGVKATYSF